MLQRDGVNSEHSKDKSVCYIRTALQNSLFPFKKTPKPALELFPFLVVVNSALPIKHRGKRSLHWELEPDLIEINIQLIHICLHGLRTGSRAVN